MMEHEAATTTQQVFWTFYDIAAPALAAALGYAVVWLTGVIRARIRNDVARGLLQRLTESVSDAVLAVNQQTRELLAGVKKHDSPGGRRLTKSEADALRQCAMAYVKAYWGPKGLKELAKVLAGGEKDSDKAAVQVNRVIHAKIEAEVARQKRDASNIVTTVPPIRHYPMM